MDHPAQVILISGDMARDSNQCEACKKREQPPPPSSRKKMERERKVRGGDSVMRTEKKAHK